MPSREHLGHHLENGLRLFRTPAPKGAARGGEWRVTSLAAAPASRRLAGRSACDQSAVTFQPRGDRLGGPVLCPSESIVKRRKARTARPYIRTAAEDNFAPGGSSIKGMNLSGKPRHRAADANAADVGASSNTAHPAPFADVATHDRSPASELHNARWFAISSGKITLLVIAPAVAAFMHRLGEEPPRTQRFIQRNHGSVAGSLAQQVIQACP